MAVTINIIGENDHSDEFNAAIKMKRVLEETLPQNTIGEIVLYPSSTLYGYAIRDVDLVMIVS